MTIGIISSAKFKDCAKELQKYISYLSHKCLLLSTGDDLIESCELLVRAIQKDKVQIGITIDDYGIVPFMYMAKTPKIVVAQISDEYSARMTCAHNHANVLSFGKEVLTLHLIKSMITTFINTQYEGGRHKVRINMLNTLIGNK
ncbi:MAG: RpiB/LacA/LacB family sugar-phosphate isomerase [Mycoplasmataceae bacterium]|jgi:galactose-6-phosphate isomerase|nr:RpiB/LacA/LacB family sugar-phosphate isomerase [Mycoplasmataceae bacterium]